MKTDILKRSINLSNVVLLPMPRRSDGFGGNTFHSRETKNFAVSLRTSLSYTPNNPNPVSRPVFHAFMMKAENKSIISRLTPRLTFKPVATTGPSPAVSHNHTAGYFFTEYQTKARTLSNRITPEPRKPVLLTNCTEQRRASVARL